MSAPPTPTSAPAPAPASEPTSFGALLGYFLGLGATGFGGPIALAGYMQRDLVEQRRWVTRDEYLEGLALAQLAPGPLAAQLAMYLGWVKRGAWGAALVGVAFVVPSFLMVVGLAIAYVELGGLPWMAGLFYGVGAAVIALVARSVWKLARMSLASDRMLWSIALAAGVVTAWTESEIVWLFLAAGVVHMLVRAPPRVSGNMLGLTLGPWLTGLHGVAGGDTIWTIAWYFAKAGAFVFGSGLAIVPFLHGGVVTEFHWLDDRQFLDAIAVAMITPGPVVITVAFIGYLVAGPIGALVAAFATFAPCYLFTVLPAPYFRRLAKNRSLGAFVAGVTAAATGAIAGAGFVLARRALSDVPAVLIALGALAILVRVKKVPEPLIILGAGLVGLLLHGLG